MYKIRLKELINMIKINTTTGALEPSEENLFETIEKYLKDNHIILFGNSHFIRYIEEKLYMKGNNEDFKLITGSFQGSPIFTYAVIKKTDDLRRFLGVDDDKRWELLLCVVQGDVEGISLNLTAVYELPTWGQTKSIRRLLHSIFTTVPQIETITNKGYDFQWEHLLLMYVFDEDYQKYWFGKKKKPRQRTHIPRGLRHEVFKRDNYTCQECGATKEDGAKLHIDHIIPVSKGGTDELDNLQTLCDKCNLNKSNLIQKE